MKHLLLLILICSYTLVWGQKNDVDPGELSYDGYIGYSLYRPHIKHGYTVTENWSGMEATFKNLVLSFHQGQFRQNTADSTQADITGYNFMIGGRAGKELQLWGGSLSSFAVKPYIQPSFSISRFPSKNLKEGVTSMGFVLAPGLQFRFSQFYLAAQYNSGLHANFSPGGGKYNLNKGYSGGLQLTVGINNAFDILAPVTYKLTGNHLSSKSKSRTYHTYVYDSWEGEYVYAKVKETTTITTRTPGEISRFLMRPFLGFGPTYSYNFATRRQAPTSMIGGNIGIRMWALMLDGFYEEGSMGLQDQVGKEEILITYPRLRNYDFSAQVKASQYGGRAGLNLTKFLPGFEPDDASKKKTEMKVPFVRLNIFYAFGKAIFSDNLTYTYEDAEARLADYQEKKDMEPSADNNPNYLPEETNFGGFGFSLEIGSAFIKATNYKYKNAAIADHTHWTIGANIPIGRIIAQGKAKRRYKKAQRDQ